KTPSYTKSVSWQHHRKIEYIAPGEHKQLPLPASGGKNVKWAAINDYGGSSGTETRPLQ
ncbi:fimbrial biogenesis chaperone, partial [Escherichia coli]